jgi:hypothetical protein
MKTGLRTSIGVVALVGLLLTSSPSAAQPANSATARTFTNASLGLTVVGAEIALPPGQWDVTSVAPANVLEQVFAVRLAAPDSPSAGRRVMAAQIQKNIESVHWRVQGLSWACRQYAVAHGGKGPSAFTDLDAKEAGYQLETLDKSPWPEDAGKPMSGPFYFLVPATPIQLPLTLRFPGQQAPQVPPGTPASPPKRVERVPLILELRPYVDDGKHWVAFSDGSTERVAIDQALVAKYKLALSFVRSKNASVEPPDPKANVRYMMLGLLRNPTATTATVTLTDAVTGRRTEVQWALGGGRSDPMLITEWAMARAREWEPLLDRGASGVLQTWMARTMVLYSGAPVSQPGFRGPDQMPRTTDAFSVLGGRAALRETLQMQLLGSPSSLPSDSAPVPISTLKGVEVKSLPFDRMLAGKPGGRVGLADYVPIDRSFLYFAKPSAVFPLLDSGGAFLAQAGSLSTSSAHDDDLKGRYLRRLGLTEGAGRKFLESGEVTELAFVTSDLFFIDGTDITIIMRVRSPDMVAAALRLLGIIDLKNAEITEKPTASGRAAYWARQGDMLGLSTSRGELDRVLMLANTTAAESLGRSAEFRYMLTELPVRSETRALAYLSDPFIRRMVGPAVKIGQLRRMRARADMEMITAGVLLARLDGHRDKPDLTRLIDLGYVPRGVTAGNYRLQDDLSVVSPRWGTPAEMIAIDTASIDTVTGAESRAYQSYINEYSQYWRQYFDPIAMRLDDAPGGALELSTFILPLIDSQLYNQLRGIIETREHGPALRVPVVTPEPVFQISLNMTDETWVGISGGWSDLFTQYTGISPAIFDVLGPGLHIALQDADPIIALGTADLLGAFGGTAFGRSADFMIPAALSVLTRPCKIFVELQDPQRALDLLRRAARGGASGERREFRAGVSFRQVDGRDAWIYTLGVPGIATIRLGLEVQNGYLVFSNIPWSQPVEVTSVEPRQLNGAAMHVAPDGVRQGLAGLFATQAEQNQVAALSSMASLLPLLQAVSATPEDAASLHAALFGSRPLHPGRGSWIWKDGKLESSVYGSATRWKEPIYKPEMGNFGLFDGTTLLDLNMQFEAGGLRAVCRWIWKDGSAGLK